MFPWQQPGGSRAGDFGSRGQSIPWPREGVRKGKKQHKSCPGDEGSSQGFLEHESSCAKPCFYSFKGEEMVPSDQCCSSEQIDAGNREMLH